MRSELPWFQNQIKKPHKKEYLQSNITDEHRCKNTKKKYLQTIHLKSNNTLKTSFTTIRWELFLGCKGGSIFLNQYWNINKVNKRKDKKHMIISIDAAKAFDKVQHVFMIKTFNKVSLEGTYFIIKAIYENIIANIILLPSEPRQGCPLWPLLTNILMEVLATEIRKQKEIKGIQSVRKK